MAEGYDASAKIDFYGDPRGPHGVNDSWFSKNVIRVTPPWKMLFAGKPIKSIAFHKKCAGALGAALDDIWAACDKDQKTIEKNGLQEFGGSFNYRLIRGSNAISKITPSRSRSTSPRQATRSVKKGKMPAFAVKAFKRQGTRWGGDYKGRKDWMHFEAVS